MSALTYARPHMYPDPPFRSSPSGVRKERITRQTAETVVRKDKGARPIAAEPEWGTPW